MTTARLNRLRSLHNSLKRKLDRSSHAQRKARTRTLIQLGGLVHKVGLTEKFGIVLGEDLQVDEKGREKAERLEELLQQLQKNSLY